MSLDCFLVREAHHCIRIQVDLLSSLALYIFYSFTCDESDASSTRYDLFRNLRIFTVERGSFVDWANMDFLVKFPPNLEVLCLDFYLVPPNLKPSELFEEELYLSNVLANIKFPNLREVIVPEESSETRTMNLLKEESFLRKGRL